MDVADGKYDGFPLLGMNAQNLESDSLRRSLGMNEEETGMLATRIWEGSSAWEVIKPGDVLLSVEGLPIANDVTVPWPDIGRMHVTGLVRSKFVGDKITVGLLRQGQRIEAELQLRDTPKLVPGRQAHNPPTYLIFGGLVFRPLTYEYLNQYGNHPPADLTNHAFYQNIVTPERSQIILISRVLPNPINRGYQHLVDYIVETVNGVVPRDMAHLAMILDTTNDPWVQVITEDRTFVTLNTEDARSAQTAILDAYGVARDRSPDLGQVTMPVFTDRTQE